MPERGLEARYKRYKEILKNLTIMKDIFARNVLKKWECTEHILRVILEDEELCVVDQVLQKDYKNLQGRSAALDCVARDAAGRQINLEIQQDNEGAAPKRARYHGGLMDMNTLDVGQSFDKLPESCVIFITQKDALGCSLPISHITRIIEENAAGFEDGTRIIYVNAQNREDTPLGRLMHDLNCTDADRMHSRILADRVRELKETEGGVEHMCREMDELYNEGVAEGIEQGIERGIEQGERASRLVIARSMLRDGMPKDKIIIYTGLTPEELSALAGEPGQK